jgi:hypothetical protein
MSYIIGKDCVGCIDTSCVNVCPVDCINGPIMIDGLGNALFAISPASAKRNPISIVWYEEDEQVSPTMLERIKERKRERSFEHQNARLFATSEAV